LSESEIARHLELFKVAKQGKTGSFEALRVVLKAALVSPRFLFREEARIDSRSEVEAYPLDDFALANRLSYFLWSSLPDEKLWERARSGTLRTHLEKRFAACLPTPKPMRSSAILPVNGYSFVTWKCQTPTGVDFQLLRMSYENPCVWKRNYSSPIFFMKTNRFQSF
jgi:hypothetical protein